MFQKATKKQAKLRMCLSGGSGSGKTYSALKIAKYLGTSIALIDTEHGSATKYSDMVDVPPFDVCEVTKDYHPDNFMKALEYAAARYDVVICDSLTHFWNGPNGFLDLVDKEAKKMQARGGKADSFAAWKSITPLYNNMVQAILSSPAHVIVTLRAKQEYSKEGGKVTKLGVAPEMRDGFQYELDVEGLIDQEHNLLIGKTRCPGLDGKLFHKPGKEVADILTAWLSDGAPAPERVEAPPPPVEDSSVFNDFITQLNQAGDHETLKTIAALASVASAEKRLSAAQFATLGNHYQARKKAVAA